MRPKTLPKQILLIIIFLVITILAVYFLYFISKSSAPSDSTLLIEDVATSSILSNQERTNIELPASTDHQRSRPVRLKISRINVDAPVKYVGLTSDGAMDVPENPDDVAWFNLGPRPGEVGNSVIAGHYGWRDNVPAIFDNLHKLRIGDEISIEDESGEITTFVVRETRSYDKNEIAPEVFGLSDGKAHLNLITCAGAWSKDEESYSERFVVFTDKK